MKKSRFYRLVCLPLLMVAWNSPLLAETDTAQKRQFVVAFAQDTMANDWRVAQVRQLQQAFAAHPEVKFVYSDGKGDTARQVHDIDNFIYQKVDVLMASPRDSQATVPVLAKAYRQGIPVVLISRSITADEYTTFVAPDNTQIAKHAADVVAKALNGQGKIFILQGIPTASTVKERTQGFLDQLQKYPGLQVVASRPANYLRADAIRVTEEVLRQGISFDAIYAQSDSMAIGARLALHKKGINPADKVIVGIDYVSEAREAIRSKEQTASFVYPTSAVEAAQVVLKILRGETVPKKVVVNSMLVTIDNVERLDPIF